MPQLNPILKSASHRFDSTILREYDIRGIYQQTLNEDDAYAIGLTFGTIVRRKGGSKIVTAYDGRTSSPILHDAMAKGLRETGCDVLHIGIGPTPMGYFANQHLNADAAVVVTGSHNPPTHNGFKFILNKKPFFGAAIQDLGLMAQSGDWDIAQVAGALHDIDVRVDYVARLIQDIKPGRDLKIAWDAGNGSSGDVLKVLTGKLPGTHIVLYADIDGTFPNHHPDPAVESNMTDLKHAVLDNKCDLGIAFDGDGDRIGVIDEQGHMVS
ncbi:MAG TPA: phosphomannomutase, partial [Alphaproteobacteria bacterium]